MKNNNLKGLDLNVLTSKESTVISNEEALRDVVPIQWTEEVLNGEKKITITK